jgi:acyl-CoA thioesterase
VPESGLPPAGVRPEFTQHFEYRGLPPRVFGAAARSGANGWVRAREPGPRCDAPLVVALIDAWWPAAFARMSTPRPMTTLSFTFQLFIDPSTLDPSQPLVYRASNPLAHDGYTLELRELWTADGRAVAQNQQTFVVLK